MQPEQVKKTSVKKNINKHTDTKGINNKKTVKTKQKNSQSSNKKFKENTTVSTFKNVTFEQWMNICHILIVVHLAVLLVMYIYSILWLRTKVITNNILLIAVCAVAPFFVWAYSTKLDYWNYHQRKRTWLYICIINAAATIEQPLIYLTHKIAVAKILQIKITENMTKGMVVNLGRIVSVVPIAAFSWLIGYNVHRFIRTEQMQSKINDFKITHHVDMREYKENLYDLNIINDLETGKPITILENDRFVHMFINGQSGTGKTSSTIIPAVAEDLNTKIKNLEVRQEELLQMIKNGECYVAGPYNHIDETNIRPKKAFKKKYEELYKKYPDCGMTIMAPNNSMNDTIVKLCEARHLKVNVIDPAKKYDYKLAKQKGIQNFYIPLNLSEEERSIRILEQAQTFSEVMIAANEAEGTSDTYFRDINTSVTTNIATICMLSANINRQQTDINEVQRCINNFSELEPMVQTIEDYFEIKIQAIDIQKKGGNTGEDARIAIERNKMAAGKDGGRNNPYYSTILFVKQELLGSGKEKMFDQARGLRNLINKIILDPRYRRILSASKDEMLSFDDILKHNEITVVNTALEFGSQVSTMLGLIFLLNFQTAVLRRPEETRSNHFIWIDEASQYMHKVYDNMFALYRQYRVATTLAMQTISQMDKVKTTSYIKNIVLGAGTQILFGRVSAEEQKLYSELAGVVLEDTAQTTVSQTSMFTENATQNESVRYTPTLKNNLEASTIRHRDFQEVSVFKIRDGRTEQGFSAKCNFLNKKELLPRTVKFVNFAKYAPKDKIKTEVELTAPAKKVVMSQKELIDTSRSNTKIIMDDNENKYKETKIEDAEDIFLEVPTETIVQGEATKEQKPASLIFGNLFEEDIVMEEYKDDLGDI